MRLLFIVSVASFCVVLWLALALARRIRRDREARKRPASPAQAVEFFEAGEFRTPRSLRLSQDVAQQGFRRNLEAFDTLPHRAQLQPIGPGVPSVQAQQSLGPTLQASSSSLDDRKETQLPQSSQAVIINSKLQFLPVQRPYSTETTPDRTLHLDISGERKLPQPARSGSFRRVDLSHYNQDMGDLTDPYTQSSRTSESVRRAKNA